jgi:hypothetical protein
MLVVSRRRSRVLIAEAKPVSAPQIELFLMLTEGPVRSKVVVCPCQRTALCGTDAEPIETQRSGGSSLGVMDCLDNGWSTSLDRKTVIIG